MTLVICAMLYYSVALVLTGIADYKTLGTDSPVADALRGLADRQIAGRKNQVEVLVVAGFAVDEDLDVLQRRSGARAVVLEMLLRINAWSDGALLEPPVMPRSPLADQVLLKTRAGARR